MRWRVPSVNPALLHGLHLLCRAGRYLEADLQRRDLTINALARDDDARIIDPYHGRRIRGASTATCLSRVWRRLILARIARGAFCRPLRSS